MIGLPGFLTGQARIHGTKSINISHIVSLNYDDFIETIKDFPKDYVIKKILIKINCSCN